MPNAKGRFLGILVPPLPWRKSAPLSPFEAEALTCGCPEPGWDESQITSTEDLERDTSDSKRKSARRREYAERACKCGGKCDCAKAPEHPYAPGDLASDGDW